jgi:hypothetical protein
MSALAVRVAVQVSAFRVTAVVVVRIGVDTKAPDSTCGAAIRRV